MKTLVALVGTKFCGPEMVALFASLPQGEPLTLVREPDNKFDRNAVQVWARGHHIGFVKGSQNRDITARMDFKITHARADSAEPPELKGTLAIDGGAQPMVEIDE